MTGRNLQAGPRSRACGRCRGSSRGPLRRFLGEQIGLTVAGRTDAESRLGPSGELPLGRRGARDAGRALNALTGDDLAVYAVPARPGLTPAATRSRGHTACSARRCRARSSGPSRRSGRTGSIRASWSAAPGRCRARTTSRRSPPPRPSTCASSGRSCGRSGAGDGRSAALRAAARSSSSGSRPTRSTGTWSGILVGTMLDVERDGGSSTSSSGCSPERRAARRGHRAAASALPRGGLVLTGAGWDHRHRSVYPDPHAVARVPRGEARRRQRRLNPDSRRR